MLNDSDSSLAMNAISHAAYMIQNSWQEAAWASSYPSVVYKPTMSLDGDQWCALYGENLQVGIAGFGDSPSLAMAAFDKEWTKKVNE